MAAGRQQNLTNRAQGSVRNISFLQATVEQKKSDLLIMTLWHQQETDPDSILEVNMVQRYKNISLDFFFAADL